MSDTKEHEGNSELVNGEGEKEEEEEEKEEQIATDEILSEVAEGVETRQASGDVTTDEAEAVVRGGDKIEDSEKDKIELKAEGGEGEEVEERKKEETEEDGERREGEGKCVEAVKKVVAVEEEDKAPIPPPRRKRKKKLQRNPSLEDLEVNDI